MQWNNAINKKTHLHLNFWDLMQRDSVLRARQKRIIIDDKYYFIDLVFIIGFYICNVIIELKNDEFKQEGFGTA